MFKVLLGLAPMLLFHMVSSRFVPDRIKLPSCLELMGHKNCRLLPTLNRCGPVLKEEVEVGERIYGGHEAKLGQFPWIAFLKVTGTACGGSLISDRYVLTAAHCCDMFDERIEDVTVRLGELDLTSDVDCSLSGECAPPAVNVKVDNLLVHELYDNSTYHHDICLVRLKQTVKFNKYVAPICLPVSNKSSYGLFEEGDMEVAGWGFTEVYTSGSPTLQSVSVPVVSRDKCQALWEDDYDIEFTYAQICAGGITGKDSCAGDSGGPLMKRTQGHYFLVGVVSGGDCPCGNERPAYHTRVSQYIPWILANIKK